MTVKTIKAKLITKKEEPGDYTVLVFHDLDVNRYLMCTKLPQWNTKAPDIDEIGFLQYREFIAGQDTWFNSATGGQIPFNYTGLYFWDFVVKQKKITQELVLD
jgi:hypothetical protein